MLARTLFVKEETETERNVEFTGTYVQKADNGSANNPSEPVIYDFDKQNFPKIEITPPKYDDIN